MFSLLLFNHSTTFLVPLIALPSSSEVIINEILPKLSNLLFSSKNSIVDEIKVAIYDFVSTAPLPQS